MTSKGLLTLVLLGFVGVSVATLIYQETRLEGTATADRSAPPTTTTGTKLVVYYLHGKVRCVTCDDIEKTAREAVEAGFADELASGRIEWRTVNYDEPGNEHHATDFQLAAPCVVLATMRDGRRIAWKGLPEVWELIVDKAKFRAFIQDNVREWTHAVAGPVALSSDRPTAANEVTALPPEASSERLPMLLDLGSGRCIPCKEMAPILVSLRETYRGRLDVVFLDVWDDPDAAEKHGVSTIPTQIFLDAQGQERFRHEGFYSREEILAKWRELGVELDDARVEPRHDGGGPS